MDDIVLDSDVAECDLQEPFDNRYWKVEFAPVAIPPLVPKKLRKERFDQVSLISRIEGLKPAIERAIRGNRIAAERGAQILTDAIDVSPRRGSTREQKRQPRVDSSK